MLAEPPLATQLTWLKMKRREPRLEKLEQAAAACRHFRGHQFWRAYETLKRQLRELVGWDATDPLLATIDAYNIAHDAVLGRLEGHR